ncbi:MAG: family 16 glycoside hydrolase [Verrucomicrobiota bacterium]
MHAALYHKPGVFIWSIQSSGEGNQKSIGRTTLPLDLPAPVAGSGDESLTELPAENLTSVADSSDQEASSDAYPLETGDEAAAQEEPEASPDVISLFNGEDLENWEITNFGGEGDVFVNQDGNLEFGFGAVMTGVTWSGEVPATSNYEITLEAMKLDGYDFFLGLTFPVAESHATLIVGGWGGGVVGISNVDELDASENETMNIEGFARNEWYAFRLRVTDRKIEAWIDEEQKVDLLLEGREISLKLGDIQLSSPLGIASFQTRAQYRNLNWRHLDIEAEEPF